MDFEMEVRFDSGTSFGDDSDPRMLVEIALLIIAKAAGRNDLAVGIGGGRTKTVGDIRAIDIRARWEQ